MDPYTLLDTYNSNQPPEQDPSKTVTRDKKDTAFYGAIAASDDQSKIPETYQSILSDISRFGDSPILRQVNENYRAEKQVSQKSFAEEILMDATKSPLSKVQTIQNRISADEASISPKNKATEILVTGASNSGEIKFADNTVWKSLPGKVVRTDDAASRYMNEDARSFVEKALDAGMEIVVGTSFIPGVAGTISATKKMKEAFQNQGVGESISDLAELTGTTLSALWRTSAGGLNGLYQIIATQDPQKANEAIQKMQEGVYKGDGELYNAGLELLGSVGQVIDAPFQMIGEIGFRGALKATNNIDVAAGTGTVLYLAPMSAVFTPKIFKRTYEKVIAKKTPAPDARFDNRVEPTFDSPVGVDPSSPAGVVAMQDRGVSAKFSANGIKDETGGYADAMGTTREDLIQTTVLPKLDPNLKEIHPDAYQRLQELDADVLSQIELNKVDPYLYDPAAIGNDMDKFMGVLERQNNPYIMRSSSYVEDSGSALRGHVVFGKAENKGFEDAQEVFDNFVKLQKAINEETGIPFNKIRLSTIEDPMSGEKFLKWDFEKYYDPVVNTSLGTSAMQATFGKWDVSKFANTAIGKFIFSPHNRLIQWITEAPGLATMRSTNITKDFNKAIRERILTIKSQKELHDLIVASESEQKYFTPQDIDRRFPSLSKKDYLDLVEAYSLFRRMDDHLYHLTNMTYRNQKIAQGLGGLYDFEGNYLKNLGRRIEPDENGYVTLFSEQTGHATEIYDFTPVKRLDPNVKTEVSSPRGPIQINTKERLPFEVYKLDKPITVDGKRYEYATGVQKGAVPQELIPKIVGHFPHVNEEPYFIKAFPKELWVNGNKIENTPENAAIFNEAATTVGVARTEKSAYQFAKDLQKDNPNFTYDIASDRLTADKNLETYFEQVKSAKDWGMARKRERLELPDGTLGNLKDPLEAMHDAFQMAAKSYAFKDFDRVFRDRWVYSYGEFSGGKFPESIADIKLDPNRNNPINRDLFRAAKNSYEQYAKQLTAKESVMDRFWRDGNMWLAKQLEEVSPIFSNMAREMSTKRDPVTSSLLKLAFVRSISLSPLKQYIVQPAQLNELVAMAATNGNLRYPIELARYGPELFTAIVLKSNAFKRLMPDAEKLIPTDPTFRRMLKAFEDTGIPSSINMHAVVDGVFLDAKSGLATSSFEQIARKVGGVAKAIGGTPRAVGFDKAELINQIGMWIYSKTEFERLNPGKMFDDPHNAAMISAKSLGIGNFMLSRADLLPYQEGTFRFLMQFQAFGNKAVLQPFSSKSLTTAEKTRLAAIRLAMYGKRGILGGELLDQAITQAQDELASSAPEDVTKKTTLDTVLDVWRRGFSDLLFSKSLQAMFDDPDEKAPKTDISLAKSMAPSPESTVPMLDLMIDFMKIANQDQSVGNSLPALTGVSAFMDTVNVVRDGLYVGMKEPETKDESIAYIRKLASWASGWSNFEKALAMKEAGSIVDKNGHSLEVGTTATEAFFQAIGVTSIKYDYYYEVVANNAKLSKEIKASATSIVNSLDFVVDTYGADKDLVNLNVQMTNRIQSLVTLYDKNGLGDELRKEVFNQLKTQQGKGISVSIMRLLQQHATTYEGLRRSSAEKLQTLKEISGEKTATMIEKMNKEMWGL